MLEPAAHTHSFSLPFLLSLIRRRIFFPFSNYASAFPFFLDIYFVVFFFTRLVLVFFSIFMLIMFYLFTYLLLWIRYCFSPFYLFFLSMYFIFSSGLEVTFLSQPVLSCFLPYSSSSHFPLFSLFTLLSVFRFRSLLR